jgi:hypothetical protein
MRPLSSLIRKIGAIYLPLILSMTGLIRIGGGSCLLLLMVPISCTIWYGVVGSPPGVGCVGWVGWLLITNLKWLMVAVLVWPVVVGCYRFFRSCWLLGLRSLRIVLTMLYLDFKSWAGLTRLGSAAGMGGALSLYLLSVYPALGWLLQIVSFPLFSLAACSLVLAAIPPVVFLLSTSESEKLTLQLFLWHIVTPYRAVSLLRMHEIVDPELGERLTASILYNDSLRTRDDKAWMSTARRLMRVVPIIVLDARHPSQALVDEAKAVFQSGAGYKTVVLGDFNSAPAFLDVLLLSGMPEGPPLRLADLNLIDGMLRGLVQSRRSLPSRERWSLEDLKSEKGLPSRSPQELGFDFE